MFGRKWFGLLLVLGLVLLAGCGAPAVVGTPQLSVAAGSGGSEMGYTINVNGSGVASAAPDIVDIRLGVETIDSDAGEAIASSTERMNAVLEAIEALGVEAQDIQTVNYNMWVEQVYDREGTPTDELRYHVVNELSVRLRDISQTGQLLEDALEAGANTVQGIAFGIEDTASLMQEAREEAIANARTKAEALAQGLGVSVGKVHQVMEYSSMPQPAPMPRMVYDSMGGGGEVPISGGTLNIQVEVQVVFDIVQ